jgi:hypothetical protein
MAAAPAMPTTEKNQALNTNFSWGFSLTMNTVAPIACYRG